MSSNQQNQGRAGDGNGFIKAAKFFIRLMLTAFLVLALASIMWFGWQWLESWMAGMNRQTALLETDTNYLLDQAATSQAQINILNARLASGEQFSSNLDATIDEEVRAQETVIFELEEMAASGRVLSETVKVLSEGVSDLQSDVNANLSQIDAIGGRADAFIIRAATIEAQLAAVETLANEPGEEVIQLGEALRWFHIWQIVSSARLRIAENNPGSAAKEIEQAQITAAAFLLTNPDDEDGLLASIAERLTMARSNLPEDPAAAALDLESAWGEIDDILANLLDLDRGLVDLEELNPLLTAEVPALAGTPTLESSTVEATATLSATLPATPPAAPSVTPTP